MRVGRAGDVDGAVGAEGHVEGLIRVAVGNSPDWVVPARSAAPLLSTTMPASVSARLPPMKVEYAIADPRG